jgi:hypothetical protein
MRLAPVMEEKSTSWGLRRTTLPMVDGELNCTGSCWYGGVDLYRISHGAGGRIELAGRAASGRLEL